MSERGVSTLKLVLILFAGIFAISASAILINLAKGVPSLSIAFWRVTFSLLLLLPLWTSKRRRQELMRLTSRQRLQLAASGLCLGVHFWSWIASLSYTSVAASVLLVTTNPLWVGLLAPWVTRERLSWRAWGGIGVAMLGAAIVAFEPGMGHASDPLLGNALALLGAIAASGYLMFGRNVRPYLELWSYTSMTLVGAWAVLTCGMLWQGGDGVWIGFSLQQWGLLISMALLPQLVGHSALSWSLRYLRADTVSVVLLNEPIGAALLAWWILGQVPSGQTIFGGVILLLGVFVVLRSPRRH